MKTKVCIIDYGMGNIGSIQNMMRYLGVDSYTSSCPDTLNEASHIVLPGGGKFDAAINNLNDRNLIKPLKEIANCKKIPIMGICLGMQILCKKSEEGVLDGLGIIDAEVKLFKRSETFSLKVPHMGWNFVESINNDFIFNKIHEPRFYFVHSYYVCCNNKNIIGKTRYGNFFVSAFREKNIVGLQFHPEKSHKYGIRVFKNFLKLEQ